MGAVGIEMLVTPQGYEVAVVLADGTRIRRGARHIMGGVEKPSGTWFDHVVQIGDALATELELLDLYNPMQSLALAVGFRPAKPRLPNLYDICDHIDPAALRPPEDQP